MYYFDVIIHCRSPKIHNSQSILLSQKKIDVLLVQPELLETSLGGTFEEVGAAINQIDRAYFEPDGSFVWRGVKKFEKQDKPWQLDGMLFDRNGRLFYVELKGSCPTAEFDRMISNLGWPEIPLMFQLKQAGVYLCEEEFRALAVQTSNGRAIAV